MFIGVEDPTEKTVGILKRAIMFGKNFRANRCVIQIQRGPGLAGEMPVELIDRLSARLKEHLDILNGRINKEELMSQRLSEETHPEVRHTGTRLGKMKNSDIKLEKDVDREGMRECSNPHCDNFERQPMQFSQCSRCNWVVYCSRECQKNDWKRHKKECKTEASRKKAEFEAQNKDESSLQYGQSQQLLTIVRFLHHFATTSEEMTSSQTIDAKLVNNMILPRYKDVDLGTLQLGSQEVGLIWNAIWSMRESDRNRMFQRFLGKMSTYSFPFCFEYTRNCWRLCLCKAHPQRLHSTPSRR